MNGAARHVDELSALSTRGNWPLMVYVTSPSCTAHGDHRMAVELVSGMTRMTTDCSRTRDGSFSSGIWK